MTMMNIFHQKKHECSQCKQKFGTSEELIKHARDIPHLPILKCHNCGKQFIHAKDRLHHVREEQEKEIEYRRHKK
jgi:DNA-directed RNA polymerase subunit RPC12/RpoP